MNNTVADCAATRSFVQSSADLLLPRLRASVIPIYMVQNDAPMPHGTGTLFRVADTSFLVTASHVYRKCEAVSNAGLYTHDLTQGSQLIPLSGRYYLNDEQDLAVLALSDEQVSALATREYLRFSGADRTLRELDDGWYLIHGYPSCWTSVDLPNCSALCRPYTRIVRLFEGRTNSFENFDSNRHVVFDHRLSKSLCPTSLLDDAPVHVRGISGSSIWRLIRDGDDFDSWTPDRALVIAVESAVYRGGDVVRGTRWAFIHYVVDKCFPELRKPLNILIPERAPPNGTLDGLVPFKM